ncbi:unnamed protein product, partial [Didymodactylos carnosus]
VGDTFHSFEEFKRKLNNYSSETGAMFSIGHSTKLKHTSELVYGTVVFYCCHGGKIRNRSNGISIICVYSARLRSGYKAMGQP